MRALPQRRLHALAVRMHAHANFEAAVRRHPHRRLIVTGDDRKSPRGKYAGAVRGLLAIGGKADPDAAAVGLAACLPRAPCREVELLAHELEAPLIIVAV